ncbi:hypothetical protein SNARM312S_03285 [Streptomyces narbonensis]
MNRRDAAGREPLRHIGGRDDRGGPGLGENGRQPLGGEVRIEEGVRRARLEHGEQRTDQVGPTLQVYGDDVPDPHPMGVESAGEPGGLGVERAVRDGRAVEEEGGRVGGAGRLRLEDPVDTAGCRGLPLVARYGDQPAPFLVGEEVDGAEGLVGFLGESGEQDPETMADALHGGVVEEVGGVSERPVETRRTTFGVVPLLDPHRQVELGRTGADGDRLDLQARPGDRAAPGAARVLLDEHHLEEGVAGEGAGRVELLDQPLEGKVLVGEGLQVGVPDTGDQLTERRIARGVRPQHQGVEEEADELVQGIVRTPGHRRPEGNVGACPEPGEQAGQSRLAHHEHGRTRGPRQLHHAAVHPGVESHRDRVAPMTRHSRAHAVRGQRQLLRKVRQHLAPVAQLTRRHALRILHAPSTSCCHSV